MDLHQVHHELDAPTAQEILTRRVHTIESTLPLEDVIAFLLKHDYSNALVVSKQDNKRRLLGILSEGDCLEAVGNELFYGNPSPRLTAEDIMKRHPYCVDPETDVFTLTSIFTSHRYHHLPVVADQDLLGIVSRRDVLAALEKYYRGWARGRVRERFPVDVHKIMNHRFIVARG